MKWPINQAILFKDQPVWLISNIIHQRKRWGIKKITNKYALWHSIYLLKLRKHEESFASFHSFSSPSAERICIRCPQLSCYFYKRIDAAPHHFHQKARHGDREIECLAWIRFQWQTKDLRHCPNLAGLLFAFGLCFSCPKYTNVSAMDDLPNATVENLFMQMRCVTSCRLDFVSLMCVCGCFCFKSLFIRICIYTSFCEIAWRK